MYEDQYIRSLVESKRVLKLLVQRRRKDSGLLTPSIRDSYNNTREPSELFSKSLPTPNTTLGIYRFTAVNQNLVFTEECVCVYNNTILPLATVCVLQC